jgi:hypothetical protein
VRILRLTKPQVNAFGLRGIIVAASQAEGLEGPIAMALEGLVLGLIVIAVGAAFTYWGYRFFLLLLPLWGFLFGFIVGADVVTYLFNTGFLATITSWVVGVVVGVVFAALSYLYYWFAVVWLGATAGYALGTGAMAWLTPNADILNFVVALIVAAVFAVVFVVLRVPKFLAIAFTAFGGAFALMAGIALVLGRVGEAAIHNGTVGMYVRDELSWLWVAAAIVLGVCGFVYQTVATASTSFVRYDDYRNPGMPG